MFSKENRKRRQEKRLDTIRSRKFQVNGFIRFEIFGRRFESNGVIKGYNLFCNSNF